MPRPSTWMACPDDCSGELSLLTGTPRRLRSSQTVLLSVRLTRAVRSLADLEFCRQRVARLREASSMGPRKRTFQVGIGAFAG